MNFRVLTDSDFSEAVALNNSIPSSVYWFPGDETYERTMMNSKLNFGAFENNRMVGKVGFRPISKNTYDVNNMIVHPDYHHRGIGKQLFSYALNELISQKHPKKILLFTYPKNTSAISLYEQFGFVKKEVIQNKYGPGMHRVRMEKYTSFSSADS